MPGKRRPNSRWLPPLPRSGHACRACGLAPIRRAPQRVRGDIRSGPAGADSTCARPQLSCAACFGQPCTFRSRSGRCSAWRYAGADMVTGIARRTNCPSRSGRTSPRGMRMDRVGPVGRPRWYPGAGGVLRPGGDHHRHAPGPSARPVVTDSRGSASRSQTWRTAGWGPNPDCAGGEYLRPAVALLGPIGVGFFVALPRRSGVLAVGQ